jgi:hypothetical protein
VPLPLQYSLLAVTCYETRDVWSSKLVNRIGKMLHVQCDRAGCALCYVGNVKTALTCRERFTCICGHSCYVDHTVFKMCCAGQRWCVDVRDCCQEYYILYRSFLFVFLPYYLTVKSFFLQFTHSLRGWVILETLIITYPLKASNFMKTEGLLPFPQLPADYPIAQPV